MTSLPQDPTAGGSYSRSDSALAECNHPESKSDTVHSLYSVAHYDHTEASLGSNAYSRLARTPNDRY